MPRARVLGVQQTQFIVLIDQIEEAQSYTVRVYLEDSLVDEIQSPSTSITITGVNPIVNEYYVSVAYNTPTPSDFSSNVSTSM